MSQANGTNSYFVAKWVVSPNPTQGTHTTISGALAVAQSGDNIFVREGTYTENPTLVAGVNISGLSGSGSEPTIILNGTMSAPASGACIVSHVRFQNTSGFGISHTGTSTATLTFKRCNFQAVASNVINFSSSASTATITLELCTGNIQTAGYSYFTHTAAGMLRISYCRLSNAILSTTASTASSGTLILQYSQLLSPVTTSGTNLLQCYTCDLDNSAINTTPLTVGGSDANMLLDSVLLAGTASALSVGSRLTFSSSTVSSSNTNAITGAGTLTFGDISFIGISSAINTTTQTPIPLSVQQGGTGRSSATSYALIAGGTLGNGLGPLQSLGTGTAGQILVSNGSTALPTFQSFSINVQTFTASGTYTPSANMKYVDVEIVGAGGGGGGAAASGAGTVAAGAGGGAGEYRRGVFSAATIGSSISITIGAAGAAGAAGSNNGGNGGNTSFDSLMTANGGSGGNGSAAGTSINSVGGLGGTGGSGGVVATPGQPGGNSNGYAVTLLGIGSGFSTSGQGGSCFFGAGGVSASNTAGNNGLGFGSGGSGGCNLLAGAALAGGAGTAGYVVVTEYIF